MIDLHSHILPGIDDGPRDLAASISMARHAAADGVSLMVATPHFNRRFKPSPGRILAGVRELNDALADLRIPTVVSPGAEIAASELGSLDDDTLGSFALGGSRTLLVESPYQKAVPLFDQILFGAQARGFRVLLAHPERSPMFQGNLGALDQLVERGVLCSVTAGSMRGRFGRKVKRTTLKMMRRGLVHNVSSDSHDLERRPPGLSGGFEAAEDGYPGVTALAPWLTEGVPTALLTDQPLPNPVAVAGGDAKNRRRGSSR